MLDFRQIHFDYEPYPVGLARQVFDNNTYRELVDSFPPMDLFRYKPDKGGKYSLSQVNHGVKYRLFIRSSPPWRRFHSFIKSPAFIDGVLDMLKSYNLDLGFPGPGWGERLYLKARAIRRGNPIPHFPRLKARFEFSAMPITGGNILPHSDHFKKTVTMVIPMLREDEWRDEWGGGTSIVWPKDGTRVFNVVNDYLDFDDVETIKTFAFEPNQCLVFIKTHNSWHGVTPMTGDDPRTLRKTLTINIESS